MTLRADRLPPYRIAILNPYLQSGNRKKAEVESALRMRRAAVPLGLTVRTFARSEDLHRYRPHIVIALSYQDPKLTDFATYGTLTMPPSWVANAARFRRNILSYDAYITISPSVIDYVNGLARGAGKSLDAVYAAFSAPARSFEPVDFSRAYAAYVGTNWDGARNNDFFLQFARSDYIRCFGPKEAWGAAHENAIYGGEVPFDGRSIFQIYQQAGIGLCINHADFDAEGIPTSRVFEIPASSGVIIARENTLVSGLFGDSALYVSGTATPLELHREVKDKIEWVRGNRNRATEMARETNRIFNERLSLEIFLKNIVEHYEKNFSAGMAPASNHGAKIDVVIRPSRSRNDIKRLLGFLANQTVQPSVINLLHFSKDAARFAGLSCGKAAIELHALADAGQPRLMETLRSIVSKSRGDWIAILSPDDQPFRRHFEQCVRAGSDKTVSCIHAGVAERTERAFTALPELIADPHRIYRREKHRIAHFGGFMARNERTPKNQIALGGMMFRRESVLELLRNQDTLFDFLNRLQHDSSILFSPNLSLSRVAPVESCTRVGLRAMLRSTDRTRKLVGLIRQRG